MSDSIQTTQLLDTIAKVLLRCTGMGLLLLLIWAAGYALARGVFYEQGRWFGLSPHELDLIHYCGLGLLKSFVLLFFVFPYISIRLVLRKPATATLASPQLAAKRI